MTKYHDLNKLELFLKSPSKIKDLIIYENYTDSCNFFFEIDGDIFDQVVNLLEINNLISTHDIRFSDGIIFIGECLTYDMTSDLFYMEIESKKQKLLFDFVYSLCLAVSDFKSLVNNKIDSILNQCQNFGKIDPIEWSEFKEMLNDERCLQEVSFKQKIIINKRFSIITYTSLDLLHIRHERNQFFADEIVF